MKNNTFLLIALSIASSLLVIRFAMSYYSGRLYSLHVVLPFVLDNIESFMLITGMGFILDKIEEYKK